MTVSADQPAPPAPSATMSRRSIFEALSGLLLVLFVAMLSETVVSTALPQIIGALKGSQSQYTWVVTATLLTATASTPIWGKLADLYDKKRLLQASIVIFVVASIASGFARNGAELIAFRALQGLGVGALQILVQIVMAAMISPRDRGRYYGYLGGVMAVDYSNWFWTREAGTVAARPVGLAALPARIARNVTDIAIRDMGGIFVPVLFRSAGESGLEAVGLGPPEDGSVPSMGSATGTKVVSLVLTLVAAFLCLSLYPSAQAGAPDPLFAVVCPTTSRRPPKRRCQSE